DNRGTPNRGKKFAATIRLQQGGVELKDQLTALDQLFKQFPQLDRARTGIWGWSGGGSMTLYALTHSDRFKTGIAVAPVTSWRNYDPDDRRADQGGEAVPVDGVSGQDAWNFRAGHKGAVVPHDGRVLE